MRRDITYKINNQPKFVRAITFAVQRWPALHFATERPGR